MAVGSFWVVVGIASEKIFQFLRIEILVIVKGPIDIQPDEILDPSLEAILVDLLHDLLEVDLELVLVGAGLGLGV